MPDPQRGPPRAGKHLVHYEDNEREWLDLRKERVDWVQGPPDAPPAGSPAEDGLGPGAGARSSGAAAACATGAVAAAPMDVYAASPAVAVVKPDRDEPGAGADVKQEGGAAAAPPGMRKPDSPSGVGVCCNGLRGAFDALRMVITLGNGKRVSPTEFERLAGKVQGFRAASLAA